MGLGRVGGGPMGAKRVGGAIRWRANGSESPHTPAPDVRSACEVLTQEPPGKTA